MADYLLLAGNQPLHADGTYLLVSENIGTGSGPDTPDILVCSLAAGGGRDEFVFGYDELIDLSQPVLSSGPFPALVEVRYNQLAWETIDAFNARLISTDPAILMLGYQFTIRVTAADAQAVSVEITATYHG